MFAPGKRIKASGTKQLQQPYDTGSQLRAVDGLVGVGVVYQGKQQIFFHIYNIFDCISYLWQLPDDSGFAR